MRNPGDDDAKRVVESLELLQSQVWFGGSDDGGGSADDGFAAAAQHLSSADLEGALGSYWEVLRAWPDDERAARLSLHVRVVIAASRGEALPAPETMSVASPLEPVAPDFSDSTRVADDGELPLSAFAYDDVTANVEPEITADAFRDEPTSNLDLADFEVVEEGARPVAAPPPPKKRAPAPSPGAKEITRIAGPGELPLHELEKQIAGEADQDLDLLLGEIEESSRPAIEASLVIDIDVDEGAFEPAPPPSRPSPSRPSPSRLEPASEASQKAFPRPTGLEPPSAILRPPSPDELERQLSRVEVDRPLSEPSTARYDSSRPPPAMALPSAAELALDPVHQPLETSEVALPSRGDWEVHEPGREASHDPSSPSVEAAVDSSWAGIRVPYDDEPATFAPGVEDLDRDSWDEPTEVGTGAAEREAEAAFTHGDLPEALRLYQELATQHPDEPRLWERVAEIARALQNRNG
jgi:hypothetical protein